MKIILILILIFSIFAFVLSSNGNAQSSMCTFCKTEVGKAEEYIKTNPPESDFIKWMDKQCDKYSSEEKQVCIFFVKQYGKDIYNWLKDTKKTPQEICVDIGFCTKLSNQRIKRGEPKRIFDQQDKMGESENVKCIKCSQSIRAIEEFLFSEYSEEEILQFGQDVCDYLPSEYAGKCQFYVDKYGDELIQMIADDKCPKLICKTIELCEDAEPNFRKNKRFMSFDKPGRKDRKRQQPLQGEGQQLRRRLRRGQQQQQQGEGRFQRQRMQQQGGEGQRQQRRQERKLKQQQLNQQQQGEGRFQRQRRQQQGGEGQRQKQRQQGKQQGGEGQRKQRRQQRKLKQQQLNQQQQEEGRLQRQRRQQQGGEGQRQKRRQQQQREQQQLHQQQKGEGRRQRQRRQQQGGEGQRQQKQRKLERIQQQGEGKQFKGKDKSKHRFEDMQMESNDFSNQLRRGKKDYKKNRKCMACKRHVHNIKTYLESNPTEDEIESYLQSYCDVYSETKRVEKCNKFLDQNIESILEKVMEEKRCFEICSELEFC
ncbi:saposin-related [Anaeramoeba flamelloides]|uniref:Saposin-related n=1 Tax=Anaeramoeba flamelloides TaxID=1746091 RepID=A0ABQ8XI35_9EUKA|nr:saposin-related [Anaeramoeba flamelloides]